MNISKNRWSAFSCGSFFTGCLLAACLLLSTGCVDEWTSKIKGMFSTNEAPAEVSSDVQETLPVRDIESEDGESAENTESAPITESPSQKGALRQEIGVLEDELRKLRASMVDFENLKLDYESQKEKMKALTTESTTLSEEITGLKATIADYQERLDAAEGKLKTMRLENETLMAENARLKNVDNVEYAEILERSRTEPVEAIHEFNQFIQKYPQSSLVSPAKKQIDRLEKEWQQKIEREQARKARDQELQRYMERKPIQ